VTNVELWFNKNYHWIIRLAKRNSPVEWGELITHFWLWLTKNWSKFSQIPDGDEKQKYVNKWFGNQVRWSSSDYNKSLSVNNIPEEFNIPDLEDEGIYDVCIDADTSDVKEWLLDISRRFPEQSVDRLILLRKIYLELSTPSKVLYDLYFTQMMSMRDISKKIDLPLSTIYNMIVELKIKIKIECGLK